VLLDGTLTEVADRGMAERLGRLVEPWLRDPRPYVLVLAATHVTGRSLQPEGSVQVVIVEDD
jgi:hypothetical protein